MYSTKIFVAKDLVCYKQYCAGGGGDGKSATKGTTIFNKITKNTINFKLTFFGKAKSIFANL